MKYIEHFYKDKEKYKKEMDKYKSIRKTTKRRHYYKLRKYIKEGKCTVDELKSLVDIQRYKLIVFYDMRRLKVKINDDVLLKHGFIYDDIQQLRERGLI